MSNTYTCAGCGYITQTSQWAAWSNPQEVAREEMTKHTMTCSKFPLSGMSVTLLNGVKVKVTPERPLGDYQFAGIDENGMRLYFSVRHIASLPDLKGATQ